MSVSLRTSAAPALLGRPAAEPHCPAAAEAKAPRRAANSALRKFASRSGSFGSCLKSSSEAMEQRQTEESKDSKESKVPSVCFDFEVSEVFELSEEDVEGVVAPRTYESEKSEIGEVTVLSSDAVTWSFTPKSQELMYAITSGSENEVENMLSVSADPNIQFGAFSCSGKEFVSGTPLALAVLRGRRACVKPLVAAGADLESTYSFIAGAQQLCWSGPASHATIPRGDTQLLKDLLDMCADLHAQGSNGASLVWQAAYFDKPEMLEMLIQRKGDIEQRGQSQDDDSLSHTPLHAAANAGHHNVVVVLLRARASPLVDNCGNPGASPLEDAIQQGHDKTTQLLVAACADLFRPVALESAPRSSRVSTTSSVRESIRSTIASAGNSLGGGDGEITRCIDQVFKSKNPGLIAAVAKGLKEAPMLSDQLCNRDLVPFLSCPGDAPLDILDAIFRPCQLLYWSMEGKKKRRARRLAAFIGHKGMNVSQGPHSSSIVEVFHRKEVAPAEMLSFIEKLAPSTPQRNSVYMPANFYMCRVPLVHQDLSLLKAIADCPEHEVFRGAGCQAIVNLKWRGGARLAVIVQVLLLFVELANFQFIIFRLHTEGGMTPNFVASTYLAAFFWLAAIIADIARGIGYVSCGLKRRYFLHAGEWLSKLEHVLIGGLLYRIWRGHLDEGNNDFVKVLLGVAACWKWMTLLRQLRNQETVGLRVLPVTVTLMEAGPFCLVLIAVLLATSSFYYALGIHNFSDCFIILFQLFALGETDLMGMENLMGPTMKLPAWDAWRGRGELEITQELPARTQYYWLLRVMFVTLSFLVGVSLMNLYVAIICSRYVQAAENAWLDFMRCRVCTVLDHHATRLGFSVLFCTGRRRRRGFIGMGSTDTISASRMSSMEMQEHCAYKAGTAYVWFAAQRVLEDNAQDDGCPPVGPSMSRVKTLRTRSSQAARR